MTDEQQERWATVPGFPCYQVSDQGRVKSLRNPKNPKMLKPSPTKEGYLHVVLTSGNKIGEGEQKDLRVHRLVAMCFIPNPNPEKRRDVGHWDSDPSNNVYTNLYWTYPAENNANPITLQRRNDARPEAIKKTSKAVYVYDEDYNQVSAFTSTAAAGRVLNTSQGNISSAARGSLPRYMGRIWSFDRWLTPRKRAIEERKAYDQFIKNRKSTGKATKAHYHREKAKDSEKYHEWLDRANKYYQKYYNEHKEEILQKRKDEYDRRKKTRT